MTQRHYLKYLNIIMDPREHFLLYIMTSFWEDFGDSMFNKIISILFKTSKNIQFRTFLGLVETEII